MNMFKKNGGFTLVELIVVIAILAILAGVAVPAYTGYIAKAQQTQDLQNLSSINTAVQGLAAAEGASVSKIEVAKAGTLTITTDPANTVTQTAVEAYTGAVASMTWSAKWNGAEWTAGEWTLK